MSTASLNEVRLIGNVGADPEGRTTDSGKRVVNLSLATTTYYGDIPATEWHRVVFWGPLAERIEKYVRKGKSLFVGGRLQANNWTDGEGHKHYGVEVVAEQFQMLGMRVRGEGADETPEPADVQSSRAADGADRQVPSSPL